MRSFWLFKKPDILLYLFWGLAALGLFLFQAYSLHGGGRGTELTVIRGNETYGVYDLSEDQTIVLDTGNTFEIKNGEVRMVYANCPDRTCVHSGSISEEGESIVCLPNHVILKITKGGIGSDLDAISE